MAQVFEQNQSRNEVLKEMWRLNNLIAEKKELTRLDIEFYNRNLEFIQRYYKINANYWAIQRTR